MTESRSLLRSGALMASGTAVSRVLGLARQSLTVAVVGLTGFVADAWNAGNTLPNIFSLLLAGGVLNAIIVPQIAKAMRRDDGDVFVNRLLTIAITIMGVATLALTIAAPFLVRLVIDGDWPDDARTLAIAFAFICLPQTFFYGLYTLLGQVLNANNRFGMFMWAPAFANVVAIVGLAWFFLTRRGGEQSVSDWDATMIWVLGGSATLSIIVQALVLIPSLRAMGFRYRPTWGLRGSGLGSVSRMAMWAFGAVAIGQAAYFVTSQVLTGATARAASTDGVAAGIGAYNTAFLVFMLPHSIITVSLVTALFTRISHSAAAGDAAAVTADLRRGLRLPAVILLPGTAALMVLAPWVLQVVSLAGSRQTVDPAVGVLVAMAAGLIPYSWFYLVQRTYYAHEDGRTPFYLQLILTGIAVSATLFAATRAPESSATWVGVGQTLSNLTAATAGFVLLRRRLGPLGLSEVVRHHVRLLVATAIATVIAGGGTWLVSSFVPDSWWSAVLLASVGAAALMAITLAIAARLQVREVLELVQPLAGRLRRA